MLTSTMPVRVPMPLVASHTYVPARSKVTGPLKNSVLFLISTLEGREPFKLREKMTNVRKKKKKGKAKKHVRTIEKK